MPMGFDFFRKLKGSNKYYGITTWY